MLSLTQFCLHCISALLMSIASSCGIAGLPRTHIGCKGRTSVGVARIWQEKAATVPSHGLIFSILSAIVVISTNLVITSNWDIQEGNAISKPLVGTRTN